MKRLTVLLAIMLVIAISCPVSSFAQQKEVKVGVLYSLTGAFSPAGGKPGFNGTMIAVDMINARGGVAGKVKLVPVVADTQSNPDVAIREVERLISVEKVPVITGVFASSISQPVAPICEKNKRVFWITISIADTILEDRHQKYVFRVQPRATDWGRTTARFARDNYKNFGYTSPKQMRVAILHEDSSYGVACNRGATEILNQEKMNVVFREAYSHTIKDMSSIILKLKKAQPDVILHTAYFPDLVLFMRQAREMGLKWKLDIGHGAGHANFAELEKSLGTGMVNYLCNVDPKPAQKFPARTANPDMDSLRKEFLDRYQTKHGTRDPETHATQGFAHAWVLFNNVMPVALQKYGKIDAESRPLRNSSIFSSLDHQFVAEKVAMQS
ncbi:MAG: ABC transporter substrate-binding protein, partial [Syntrophales bacterium]|jgi:branched-chain amino acid transport system substrate-binding protein|nr:ABC transporter substrate-binding protein [Syntrophales bacterium]